MAMTRRRSGSSTIAGHKPETTDADDHGGRRIDGGCGLELSVAPAARRGTTWRPVGERCRHHRVEIAERHDLAMADNDVRRESAVERRSRDRASC